MVELNEDAMIAAFSTSVIYFALAILQLYVHAQLYDNGSTSCYLHAEYMFKLCLTSAGPWNSS